MEKFFGYHYGLDILARLGLNDLTDAERDYFRTHWYETYSQENGDLLKTVESLYTRDLVWLYGFGDIDSFHRSQVRIRNFKTAVATTHLEEKLQAALEEQQWVGSD